MLHQRNQYPKPSEPFCIDVEEIIKLKNRIFEINKLKLENIDFYENDVKIEIYQSLLDSWDYIGLSNTDFIHTNYYKQDRNI